MDAQQGAGRGIVFPMPGLPPPPIQVSYQYSYASPTSHHSSSITNFPILLLTVLGILTTSVLLLTYHVFVIRCCLNWHSSSSSSHVAGLISGRHRGASSRLPVTGTPAAEATTRGLEESTIQVLPTFRYRKAIKKSTDSAPTSECAVCLSEFEEEERVRMLPSCLHAFHVDCIDTWLQGNANCPLCRAPITGHCMLLPSEPQRPQEVVIQVATRTEVLADDTQQQPHNRTASMAAAESAGDTTSTADQQQIISADNRSNNNAWRDLEISSKEDEWAAVKKDREVLPLRRSSSMGSMGGDEVRLQIHNILQRNAQFHREDTVSSSSNVV